MVNQVILIGNVGSEPEVKVFDNGNKAVRFSLATTEYYRNQAGEKKEKTEWHRIECYGRVAENAEKYVHRGSKLYINGSLTTREYDKQGVKCYVTSIVPDTLRFLDKKEAFVETPEPEVAQELDDLPV